MFSAAGIVILLSMPCGRWWPVWGSGCYKVIMGNSVVWMLALLNATVCSKVVKNDYPVRWAIGHVMIVVLQPQFSFCKEHLSISGTEDSLI